MNKRLKKIELRKVKLLHQKEKISILVQDTPLDTAYYLKNKKELLSRSYEMVSSSIITPENRTCPYRVLFKLKEEPLENIILSLENMTTILKMTDYKIRRKTLAHKTYFVDTSKYRIEYEFSWKNKLLNRNDRLEIRKDIETERLLKLDQVNTLTELLLELSSSTSITNNTIFYDKFQLFINLVIKKIKVLSSI